MEVEHCCITGCHCTKVDQDISVIHSCGRTQCSFYPFLQHCSPVIHCISLFFVLSSFFFPFPSIFWFPIWATHSLHIFFFPSTFSSLVTVNNRKNFSLNVLGVILRRRLLATQKLYSHRLGRYNWVLRN